MARERERDDRDDRGRGRDDDRRRDDREDRDERRSKDRDDRDRGRDEAPIGYRGNRRKVEDVVRRSKQGSGSWDSYISPNVSSFKNKEGSHTMRIMPPTWGSHPYTDAELEKLDKKELARLEEEDKLWGDDWAVNVWVHYGIGADSATYLCAKKMKNEPCAICDGADGAEPDEANQLRPRSRPVCWAIDRDDERAGPLVWSMARPVYQDINARSQDKKTGELLLVDHPIHGYDVMFDKEGQGDRAKYRAVDIARDQTALSDDEDDMKRWLDYIRENPLPSVLNFYEYDYLKRVLAGQVERKDRGDERGGRDRDRGRDDDRRRDDRRDDRRDERETRRGRDDDRSESGRRGRYDETDERDRQDARRGRDDEPRGRDREEPRGRDRDDRRDDKDRGRDDDRRRASDKDDDKRRDDRDDRDRRDERRAEPEEPRGRRGEAEEPTERRRLNRTEPKDEGERDQGAAGRGRSSEEPSDRRKGASDAENGSGKDREAAGEAASDSAKEQMERLKDRRRPRDDDREPEEGRRSSRR